MKLFLNSPYRLITDLVDIALFPALLLAARISYEVGGAKILADLLKTHLNSRKTPIRSKTPRLVVQEIYGWLLAPYRGALGRCSKRPPMRVFPHYAPRIYWQASVSCVAPRPLFQQVTTPTLPLFVSWLMEEILEQEIPPRQGRTNPRVVKKRTARAEVSSA